MKKPNSPMNRRDLLKGLAVLPAFGAGGAMAESPRSDAALPDPIAVPNKEGHLNVTGGTVPPDGFAVEQSRKLPTRRASDVIVCGGGPAGVAAALSAARNGAKVTLFEVHGCLGGVWTAGLLCNILDYSNKDGIMKEIEGRLADAGNTPPTPKFTYDPEVMKLVLEDMCVEAGIDVRYQTRLAGAIRRGDTLAAVVTESKAGREAWVAHTYIDCTGDGDLAAQAGCAFDVGIDESCVCQPMSLMALLTGIEHGAVEPYVNVKGAGAKIALLQLLIDQGQHPSYASPSLFYIRKGLFALMANHEYGVSAFDPTAVTRATIRARREVHDIVNTLKRAGGPWANLALVATAEQIGIREGRRIRGRYHVTADDLREGTRHEDAVCKVRFPVDVHTLTSEAGKTEGYSGFGIKVKAYDIPLRALVSNDVNNLLMAGRCISGDFFAHSSYRVTGNAVPMGEAAGKLAAESAAAGRVVGEMVAG